MSSLTLVPETRCVVVGNERVFLLRREYDLLSYLMRNQGLVRTREQILDAVWSGEFPTDRTVDDHIYRLRRKIEPLLGRRILFSVRGVGYMLRGVGAPGAEVMRSLTGPQARDAYLSMLLESLARGLGCQARVLLDSPPPGFDPGPNERALVAYLTGDLDELARLAQAPWLPTVPRHPLLGGFDLDQLARLAADGVPTKAWILAAMVAEELFGIRVALQAVDAGMAPFRDVGAFLAHSRILRSVYLTARDRLDEARREIHLAEREVESAGVEILRPALARARALILMRGGQGRQAVTEIEAGLQVAGRLGMVRDRALLQYLSAEVRGAPPYDQVLSLLSENCLETDYLTILRQLARRDPGWRPEFARLVRERNLASVGRRFRRLFIS